MRWYHMSMSKRRASRAISALGIIGHVSIIGQWAWLIIILLPWMMKLRVMEPYTARPVPTTYVEPAFPVFNGVVAVVAVIGVMALTIYILSKLTRYVVKESSHVLHSAKDIVLPVVTPKKKISSRRKVELSTSVLFAIKLSACLIPFFGLFIAIATRPPLSSEIILAIGSFQLVWSLLFVILQRVVAHLKHEDYSTSL